MNEKEPMTTVIGSGASRWGFFEPGYLDVSSYKLRILQNRNLTNNCFLTFPATGALTPGTPGAIAIAPLPVPRSNPPDRRTTFTPNSVSNTPGAAAIFLLQRRVHPRDPTPEPTEHPSGTSPKADAKASPAKPQPNRSKIPPHTAHATRMDSHPTTRSLPVKNTVHEYSNARADSIIRPKPAAPGTGVRPRRLV